MTQNLNHSLLVGLGGFLGSIARYWTAMIAQRVTLDWPLGTLSANVLGCFLIGFITGLATRADGVSTEIKLLFATGFCGGFTTMSSFVYESEKLLRANGYFHALLYTGSTLSLSILSLLAGILGAKALIKLGGGPWT